MAIQQHPLPQDISSYRFRLIGDMTIKQFASLGICVIFAIIVYSLPIPFFFKYPLVLAFVLLGIGMAFVPIQGRSLDIWMIAFIKSIYSPTQYIWKRTVATVSNQETAVPSKESNQAVTQPVSNASIQITQASPISITPPKNTPVIHQNQEPITVKEDSPEVKTPEIPTPKEDSYPKEASTSIAEAPSTPAPTTPTTNLPIPFTPTTPNTLVGLTLTPTSHILDGVLVEIKKNNLTLRATKSNKLGQFMFARPLDSGLYQILAEKDGFTFTPYSLELTGDIVKPLKIQAH
jgi:hypothetical protein